MSALGYVYFAATGDRKYVKIGSSRHPGSRITNIRAWAFANMPSCDRAGIRHIAVMPESVISEQEAHDRFRHLNTIPPGALRHPCEWFWLREEVTDYIESVRSLLVPEDWWHTRGRVFWPADPRHLATPSHSHSACATQLTLHR